MEFDFITYVLHMYAIKYENLSPHCQQITSPTLEIRTRQRLQLRVLTSNGLDVPSLTTCVLDDVVSQDLTTSPIAVPPRIVALPELRQYCIRNALSSLEINRTVCERVTPQIEKYMVEAAEVYDFGGFGVVAEIEVRKADIFDQHKARSSLGVIKLSTSLFLDLNIKQLYHDYFSARRVTVSHSWCELPASLCIY